MLHMMPSKPMHPAPSLSSSSFSASASRRHHRREDPDEKKKSVSYLLESPVVPDSDSDGDGDTSRIEFLLS
jgi:hypothetical protein